MNNRILIVSTIIIGTALIRLLPHPPNFTPLGAMALFAGCYLSNRILALSLPLLAMLLSDALMGFNGWAYPEQTIVVYATFSLITLLGFTLRKNKSVLNIGAKSLFSSIIFFVTTNFAVWLGGFFHKPELYSLDFAGLSTCYIAAIPFFDKTILSDLFYNALLFGGFYLLQLNVPSLAEQKIKSN